MSVLHVTDVGDKFLKTSGVCYKVYKVQFFPIDYLLGTYILFVWSTLEF